MLADNVAYIPEVSQAARQYVIKECLQHAHSKERIEFYRAALKAHNNGKKETVDTCSIFDAFANLEGAVRDSRHLRLVSTRFENMLYMV